LDRLGLGTKKSAAPASLVSTREMDGPVIADFVGKIALAEGTILLRDTIHDFLRQGNNRIILNLADVDFIDSAGLGELVRTLASVRSHCGQLKLVNPSENVHKLLRITKLHHVFDIENDEASALMSLRQNSALNRQAKTPEQFAPRVFSLRHVAGCVSFSSRVSTLVLDQLSPASLPYRLRKKILPKILLYPLTPALSVPHRRLLE
jgi:anti-sigma B factor antagonist